MDAKTRVSVRQAHEYGNRDAKTIDRRSNDHREREVSYGTFRRWLADYRKKVLLCPSWGAILDKRDADGIGTITFEYYVSGVRQSHAFDIQPVFPPIAPDWVGSYSDRDPGAWWNK